MKFHLLFSGDRQRLAFGVLISLLLHFLLLATEGLSCYSKAQAHGGSTLGPILHTRLAAAGVGASAASLVGDLQVENLDKGMGPRQPADASGGEENRRNARLDDSAEEFFPLQQLSGHPRPLTELVSPDYPPGMTVAPEARLVLMVWIDSFGKVVRVERRSSSFPAEISHLLEDSFRAMHFSPGLLDGRPTGVVMAVEIQAHDLQLPVLQ